MSSVALSPYGRFDRFDRAVEFAGVEPAKIAAAVGLSLLLHMAGYLWWDAPHAIRLTEAPVPDRTTLRIALVATPESPPVVPIVAEPAPPEPSPRTVPTPAPKPTPTSTRLRPRRETAPRSMPAAAKTAVASAHSTDVPAVATPPSPAPAATPSVELFRERYLQTLFEHIERHKFYPGAARRQGMEASVRVGFVLDRAGAIHDLNISGGPKPLRHAAQEILNHALPLPSPPPQVDVPLRVDYRMAFTLR